jgi:hypothetical protein
MVWGVVAVAPRVSAWETENNMVAQYRVEGIPLKMIPCECGQVSAGVIVSVPGPVSTEAPVTVAVSCCPFPPGS